MREGDAPQAPGTGSGPNLKETHPSLTIEKIRDQLKKTSTGAVSSVTSIRAHRGSMAKPVYPLASRRPKGAKNVTPAERDRIRELFRAGLRLEDIVRQVGRSESAVARTVRGMKRPRLKRRPRHAKRKARIAALVLGGLSGYVVGKRFGISYARAYQIAREARTGIPDIERRRLAKQRRRAKPK